MIRRITSLLPEVAAILFVLGVPGPGTASADPYDDYRAFADSAFGGAVHPLVAERFGVELLPPYDWWEQVSQYSATVTFSTNHLAVSYVEYGPTTVYGRRTPASGGGRQILMFSPPGVRTGSHPR